MRNHPTNASVESTHFGRKKCGWLRCRLALLHLCLALALCLIPRQQSGRLSHSHSHSPRLLRLSLCWPLVLASCAHLSDWLASSELDTIISHRAYLSRSLPQPSLSSSWPRNHPSFTQHRLVSASSFSVADPLDQPTSRLIHIASWLGAPRILDDALLQG